VRQCLIIGKANAGKTLFLINFAEYLGARSLRLSVERSDGSVSDASFGLADARKALVDAVPHKTLGLQTLTLSVPRGKTVRRIQLTDSAGLSEDVHETIDVRKAMAQTLRHLRLAGMVLHVVDASQVGQEGAVEAMGEVDLQIARYAPQRGPYAIIANKMDLPLAKSGLQTIVQTFRGQPVLPVSALEKRGFREVRSFVWKHAY